MIPTAQHNQPIMEPRTRTVRSKELGTGTRNRNSVQELGTGTRNRNRSGNGNGNRNGNRAELRYSSDLGRVKVLVGPWQS